MRLAIIVFRFPRVTRRASQLATSAYYEPSAVLSRVSDRYPRLISSVLGHVLYAYPSRSAALLSYGSLQRTETSYIAGKARRTAIARHGAHECAYVP